MYKTLKKIGTFFLPRKLLISVEPIIRNVISLFYFGNKTSCLICNGKFKNWITIRENDNLCPNCGSLSRDRRLWKIISEEYLQPNIKILDFSPSRSLFRKWKKTPNVKHIASDLSGNFMSDVAYDITQIPKKEDLFNLIICYHILEHVIDDIKAMNELYRILNQNGTILIQTPFKEGEIYENYNITSESERLKHFGQEDHVRIYSVEGLKKRLESVGFSVVANQYEKDDYLGFSANEIILFATK